VVQRLFWVTHEEFQKAFGRVTICYLEENMQKYSKKFSLSQYQFFALDFEIKINDGPAMVEIQQLDKLLCHGEDDY
jgi:hypothetical protein